MRTGVSGFQADRLNQLRSVYDLTLAELGDRVGCSSSTISAWEKGDQLPEARLYKRLCQVFGVSPRWFMKPIFHENEKIQRPFFYRTQASALKKARVKAQYYLMWLQEISYSFQEVMDWPEINIPKLDVNDCQIIDDDEIENMAHECRMAWGLGARPVSNVIQVMENAGIICTRIPLGHVKMDGVSNISSIDGRPYVLLSDDKSNAIRSRFDAAHELGHIVLHSHIPAWQYADKNLYKILECQAHRFASAFLMPPESFLQEVIWPTLDNFLSLKPRWKVSVAAMIVRCRDLSLLDDNSTDRLWKGRSSRRWTKEEPGDRDHEFEQPKLMRRGVEVLIDNDIFDADALSNSIGLPTKLIEELCNLPSGFLNLLHDGDNVIHLNIKPSFSKTKGSSHADIVPIRGGKT